MRHNLQIQQLDCAMFGQMKDSLPSERNPLAQISLSCTTNAHM